MSSNSKNAEEQPPEPTPNDNVAGGAAAGPDRAFVPWGYPDGAAQCSAPDYPAGRADFSQGRGINRRGGDWRAGAGPRRQQPKPDNWRNTSSSMGGWSGNLIYEPNPAMAKQTPRSMSDTRFYRNPLEPQPQRNFNGKGLLQRPKGYPQAHDLILCMPLSIPDGKICVTKDGGDNFYEFPDTNPNAQLLFTNEKGVCDVWASFLQVRLGMIHNVATTDIVRIVEIFNEAMSDCNTQWDGKNEPLEAIEMKCVGLCEAAASDLSQDYTGTKHPATICETHGQLTDGGKEILKKIRRKIKRLALSLTLEFGLPMANLLFPLRMEHVKPVHKQALYNAVEDNTVVFRDDAIRVLLNALARGILPDKIPEPYRAKIINRETWPTDDSQSPEWARVNPVKKNNRANVPDGVMTIDLQDFIRDSQLDLRVLIREWSELSEPKLVAVLREPDNKNRIVVPRVFMGEVRMEHTTKKMMDPRFTGGFVLTRQMAGEEDPRHWAEVDAGGRLRPQTKPQQPESSTPLAPTVETESTRTRDLRARYAFAEVPLPQCLEPAPPLLDAFIRRWKKVFNRSLPETSKVNSVS